MFRFWEDGSDVEIISPSSCNDQPDSKQRVRMAPQLRHSEAILKVDLEPGELSASDVSL